MHRQVLSGIDPGLPLKQVLEHWPLIREGLAEPPRKRVPQVLRLFGRSKTS